MPPDELAKFFAELTEKNNLLVLTGDKTQMASIAAYASGKPTLNSCN